MSKLDRIAAAGYDAYARRMFGPEFCPLSELPKADKDAARLIALTVIEAAGPMTASEIELLRAELNDEPPGA